MLSPFIKQRQTIHSSSGYESTGQVQRQFESLLHIVDVVSFDLFDTLVQRAGLFSPKDLFYRVQDKAERRLGRCIDDFTSVRVRAEEIARVRAWGNGTEETTFDEIYTELGRMLRLDAGAIQSLKEIELDCERSALTALESGRQLYKAAFAAGKTVVITSDTYFAEEFIIEIVRQTGYSDTHKVYASSTHNKTKSAGSLYDIILRDHQCAPSRLLHVGDNQFSDVTVPLGKGILTLNVPTSKHWLRWRSGVGDVPSGDLVLSEMLCEVSKRSAEEIKARDLKSVLEQTATENLSLLYYAFAAWLVEQLRDGGYQRVYFAARDGLIMKRFFDLIAIAAGLEIDSRYLYVSRAALYPSLIFSDPETALRLFNHNWDYLSIEDALRRISLTLEEGGDLLANHGLAGRKLRLDETTVPKFSAFLKKSWPLLERKHEEHYQLVVEYLRQEMVLNEEKAAFVDIGWHGSVQNCLVKLLKHKGIVKDFRGFYLGTFKKPTGAAADFNARGFLVDNDEPQAIAALVRSGPSVIELFHSTGHGGVLGYKSDGTRVLPLLEDNPVEQEQFRKIIEPIQNLAFDFVSGILKRLPGVKMKAPEPGPLARMALRVIHTPTIAEALAFGHLRIASDFGASMKSITGGLEWDLKKITGETLPDGKYPLWRPGFQVLKRFR